MKMRFKFRDNLNDIQIALKFNIIFDEVIRQNTFVIKYVKEEQRKAR